MDLRRNRSSLLSIACPVLGISLTIALSYPIARAMGDSEWGWLQMLLILAGSTISILCGLAFSLAAWVRKENRLLTILGTLANVIPVAYVIISMKS
ncbi:MAG: hypothetical protein OEQ39_17215 [Gammaproteobacteria bacterium]|nr:hypothetical protein [Gammaproteobacteria bacterium]MDH3468081.1 hypothetical protein [Gammaproteobacteria bacterium]